jgi:hemoglobin/transferrin/lactoferrin receptor protein
MGLVARHATVLLGSVALGTILGASGAFAQANENTNPNFITLLERIVIGAGKAKVAIDTPQAVTVVDQDDIDAQQAVTTGDLLKGVPGVTMVGSDRAFGEAFNIRGIGKTENSPDAARVIVNVDGQPKFFEQYRMGSFFGEPELYKQVEVLRGAASSTLYGAGAIGGVINFTTKDASDFIKDGHDGALKLKTTVTDNGPSVLTSAILAQRLNETFEVLAAGTWRSTDDFTKGDGEVLEGSAFDSWSGLLKGKAYFGDNDEQSLTASYQRLNTTADDTRLSQTGVYPGDLNSNNLFGIVDLDVLDETFVVTWSNPDSANPWIDSNVSLSYSNTVNEQRNHRNSDGTPNVPDPTNGSYTFSDVDYQYKTWQLKADNTVEWIGDGFENYFTFGLQASTQDRLVNFPGFPGVDPMAHPQGTEDKLGVFAQNEFVWGDLTLTPGIRGDFHKVTATNEAFPDIDGSALSAKIAALYRLSGNINLFGSVAHTERMPTIDELYSTSSATATRNGKTASLDLQKEGANSIEAGVALHADDFIVGGDSASVKVTGFYSRIDDMIVSNTATLLGNPPNTYYGNVDEAEIGGVEIEAAYNSELFFASLAYTHTEGTNLTTNTVLTTIPQDKFVLTAGLRNPEWNLEYGARVTLAAEGEYVVAAGNFGADGSAEAWQTVDLFASWKPDQGPLEGTEILASIDNLFDTDYRENLSLDRAKGRTFKLTLAKQFDY